MGSSQFIKEAHLVYRLKCLNSPRGKLYSKVLSFSWFSYPANEYRYQSSGWGGAQRQTDILSLHYIESGVLTNLPSNLISSYRHSQWPRLKNYLLD